MLLLPSAFSRLHVYAMILVKKMEDYSISNTTKEQRIALIKSWQPEDEMFDENSLDIWEIYRDYINGSKEIAECNEAVAGRMNYLGEDEL